MTASPKQVRYEIPTMSVLGASDLDESHDYGLTQIGTDPRVRMVDRDGAESVREYRSLTLDEKAAVDHARVMAMVTGSIGATTYDGREVVGRWIRDETVVS